MLMRPNQIVVSSSSCLKKKCARKRVTENRKCNSKFKYLNKSAKSLFIVNNTNVSINVDTCVRLYGFSKFD